MNTFVYTLVVTGGKEAHVRLGHKLKQGYIPGTNAGDIIICIYENRDIAYEAKEIMNEAINQCFNMKIK